MLFFLLILFFALLVHFERFSCQLKRSVSQAAPFISFIRSTGYVEATGQPFDSPETLSYSPKVNISKKAATGWELTQTKKQQTLYFDCAKHINYKKIYIYMYIQQTILCKHGKYVSFSENVVSHLINTGNVGIRRDHKKLTFRACERSPSP